MFDRDRCVLSVGDQLPLGSRFATQPFEDGQVVGARTNDSGCRTLDKLRDKAERFVRG